MNRFRRADGTPEPGDLTAQQVWNSMIREVVAPALRDLGFKGSGGRYELPSDDEWLLLGFQKSTYSSRDQVRFTAAVSAVQRDTWDEQRAAHSHIPTRPSAITTHGSWQLGYRVPQLADPGGEDRWWVVTDSVSAEAVAPAVIEAVRDYGLPWLRNPEREGWGQQPG